MTNEQLCARVRNLEKALFVALTLLEQTQPPEIQAGIHKLGCDLFDAQMTLGFIQTPHFESGAS